MKPPAFQFYVDDFLGGTMHFTDAEVGLYTRLLCVQWSTGSVPANEDELASYGKGGTPIARVIAKFEVGVDGRLRNGRLEHERAKQIAFRERQAVNGSYGGRPPKPKPNPSLTQVVTQTEPRKSSPYSVLRSPSTDPSSPTDVDRIYEAYPRKVGHKDAVKAITSALKAAPADRLLERTKAFAGAVALWPKGDGKFVPHPATWFNRGSYDDDPETWKRDGGLFGSNGHYVPRPSIYVEPPGWREKAVAKWPDYVIPDKWEDLSASLRNDLVR